MAWYQISGHEIDLDDPILNGLPIQILDYSPFIRLWMFSSDESYISQYRNTRSNIVNREKANTIRKKILAQTLNTTESEIIVESGDNGKPILRNPPSTLEFSTSYTHSCWVLAISHKGSIGIDIEKITCNPGILDVARRFFTPQEYDFLKKLDEEKKTTVFYQFWTLKEAYLKATGTGLAGLQNIPDLTGFIISTHTNSFTQFPFLDGFMAFLECHRYCLALVYRP